MRGRAAAEGGGSLCLACFLPFLPCSIISVGRVFSFTRCILFPASGAGALFFASSLADACQGRLTHSDPAGPAASPTCPRHVECTALTPEMRPDAPPSPSSPARRLLRPTGSHRVETTSGTPLPPWQHAHRRPPPNGYAGRPAGHRLTHQAASLFWGEGPVKAARPVHKLAVLAQPPHLDATHVSAAHVLTLWHTQHTKTKRTRWGKKAGGTQGEADDKRETKMGQQVANTVNDSSGTQKRQSAAPTPQARLPSSTERPPKSGNRPEHGHARATGCLPASRGTQRRGSTGQGAGGRHATSGEKAVRWAAEK